MSFGPLTLDLTTRSFSTQTAPLDLPARERDLLELLIVKAGRVVTRDAIVQSLTSLDDELSANAIEQYTSRLRKRLAPLGLTIRSARGLGYFLDRDAR
ncbi:winged helix-turn-helix domain-containing protein [Paracoccus cavernae]|uniref:winged helix-turn-helix domain-containing protein n=1 Tax=Paracoccus cavernae TaxID=1571207 RepID=UPI003637A605